MANFTDICLFFIFLPHLHYLSFGHHNYKRHPDHHYAGGAFESNYIQLLELPQTCPTLSRSGDPCVMVLANVMALAHVMVLAGRGR